MLSKQLALPRKGNIMSASQTKNIYFGVGEAGAKVIKAGQHTAQEFGFAGLSPLIVAALAYVASHKEAFQQWLDAGEKGNHDS